MRSGPVRWFWRIPLRNRLMLIGVSGLVAALVAGGIALYLGLTYAIDRTVADEAGASADQVVALIDRGTLPDPLPISGAQVIQVIDSSGRVLGGSVNADRLTPLLRADELVAASGGAALTVPGARAGLSGPLRVVTRPAGPAADRRTVIVAVQIGDVARSADLLRNILLVVFPVLLVLLAIIAWRVIGRALKPVESLRQAAARISGSGGEELLPLPAANDEIRSLAVTLNDMLARLALARERERSFVADAAHELRSPLASLQLQLEVAQEVDTGTTNADLATDALIDVRRLITLVEDLLYLARLDSGADRGRLEVVAVAGFLRDLVDRSQDATPEIALVAGPEIEILTDPDRLRRAFANVLDNARRHASTQVVITWDTVPTGPEPSTMTIVITDDGPGIPAESRERVFERFTRLDDARDRDTGGSGLGLAIVRELMTGLGGGVRLVDPLVGPATSDSATTPGLRVELILPIRAVPTPARDAWAI